MALLQLNEPILTALIARLGDDLPDAIDEINAETDDGIDLELPPTDRILPFIPSIGILRQWPVIGVQHLPGTFRDDIGSAAEYATQFAVLVFDTDADLVRLGWKLVRWERALASVVLAGRELGTGGEAAYSVQLVNTRPGPTLGDAEDPDKVKTYTSWTGVVIACSRDE
jgi:hypothetical protein